MHRVFKHLHIVARRGRPTLYRHSVRAMLMAAALAAAALIAPAGLVPQRVHAAAFTVSVGPGNTLKFVDATSGTSTTTIHVGDTVTWNWASPSFVAHSSCSGNGCIPATSPANTTEPWSSGVLGAGSTFSHTFNTAGTYTYECELHSLSGMTGSVVVLAASPSVGGVAEEPPVTINRVAGGLEAGGAGHWPYVTAAALIGALAAGGGVWRVRRRRART